MSGAASSSSAGSVDGGTSAARSRARRRERWTSGPFGRRVGVAAVSGAGDWMALSLIGGVDDRRLKVKETTGESQINNVRKIPDTAPPSCKLDRRETAEAHVRARGVVVGAPRLDDAPGIAEAVEEMVV